MPAKTKKVSKRTAKTKKVDAAVEQPVEETAEKAASLQVRNRGL